MSLKRDSGRPNARIVELPSRIFTRGGSSIDPHEMVWSWFDGPFHARIDFRRYALGSELFVPGLKQSLIPFVKGYSSHYTKNLESAFYHFVSTSEDCVQAGSIRVAHILAYSSTLRDVDQWKVGTLNVLLQKWVQLALPGVDPECATFLAERRKVGNRKGDAVRTRDPINGPLSEEEYTALHSSLNAAYGRDELPLWALVLTRLLLACGGRISQYASLKVLDFDGATLVLRLPQAKRREEHSRTSFLEFDISPTTGRLLSKHIADLDAAGLNGESALFPETLVMLAPRRQARPAADLFFGHCSPEALSQRFRHLVQPSSPPTERLNYALAPITPQRFRYTLGTRLAEEGASKIVIANRLGHADLQNVGVYVAASPKIVENIDKAMGAALAPIAAAFKGRLVLDETHTTHKGSSGSRIIDFRVSPDPVGSCGGKGGTCAFNKPVACYPCFRFEPWLDAPHEKVLHRLQKERTKWTADPRMAAVNDESIKAVKEVIALCALARNQQDQSHGSIP